MKTIVLAILIVFVAGLPPAFAGSANKSARLIVRFDGGVTVEQARIKIEKAGAKMDGTLSSDRDTYQASTSTVAQCLEAIKILNRDKTVIFAERDQVYRLDKSSPSP